MSCGELNTEVRPLTGARILRADDLIERGSIGRKSGCQARSRPGLESHFPNPMNFGPSPASEKSTNPGCFT